MKRFLCLLLALSALSAAAQRNTIAISDLPHLPSDTLPTDRPDVRIILYTDNTFRYLFTNADSLSRTELYASHWDTTGIFAYRDISLQSLPPTIEIHVIDRYDGFHFPRTGQIVSRYGLRGRRNHNGIDIALRTGDPIHAAFDGRVRYSRYNMGGFGNLVIIRHTNGLESYYGHLSRRNVKAGDFVKAGQVIGYGGSTGRSRGPHLHFELRYADQAFDPERLIEIGLSEIPARCRLAAAVREGVAKAKELPDLESFMEWFEQRYAGLSAVHTVNNAVLCAMALLRGGMNPDRSVCLAVSGGLDTDCNGATVGAVTGIVAGKSGFGGTLAGRLNGTIRAAFGEVVEISMESLAERTLKARRRIESAL